MAVESPAAAGPGTTTGGGFGGSAEAAALAAGERLGPEKSSPSEPNPPTPTAPSAISSAPRTIAGPRTATPPTWASCRCQEPTRLPVAGSLTR
jgi:hypothetical protein